MASLWVDIPKEIKRILDNDVNVQALSPTVRIGIPAKNILDSDYPVIVIDDCTLVTSDFRATNSVQDRLTTWSAPVYIVILDTMESVEDGTIYDTLDGLEQAVVSAILSDPVWNNETPYYNIEMESTDPDRDTMFPKKGITYRFAIQKVNKF